MSKCLKFFFASALLGAGAYVWTASAQQPDGAQSDFAQVAHRRLAEAKSEEEKSAIRTELRTRLSDVFAIDMQRREQQAAEIEARLAKLREQFQAREKLKDQILELQVKAIELNAGGVDLAIDQRASDMLQPAAKAAIQSDSIGPRKLAYRQRPLARLKAERPDLVAELTKLGHFVESPDGSMYAHVAAIHPHGPSSIDIVDSKSGRLVNSGTVDWVVGALQFTEDGLAEHQGDSLQLLIRHDRGSGVDSAAKEGGDAEQELSDEHQPATDAHTQIGAVGPQTQFVAEFNELREQYRKAKASIAQVTNLLADPRRLPPDRSEEQKKQHDRLSAKLLEQSQASLERAKRLLDAKIKFLRLDLKSATAFRDAAQRNLERAVELAKAGEGTTTQVDEFRSAFEAAEVNVEKTATLIELFESIEKEQD